MARRPARSAHPARMLALVACGVALVSGCAATVTPGSGDDAQVSASSQTPESSAEPDGGGGEDVISRDGGNGVDGGNGENGTDGNGGDGNQAPGSPIDVPSIPAKHQAIDDVRSGIRELFVTACGGQDLCVTLEYGDGACFAGYDPATRAERWSTVRVLTESQQECDRANGLDGSGTDGGPPDTGATDAPTG